MEKTGKPVMLVAVDESKHSFYALEWTLDHFFVPGSTEHQFELIIVHAQPVPTSILGLGGPGTADFVSALQADLKRSSNKTVEQAKELCNSKSMKDVKVEVMEGDARTVMCDAVVKHNASILVLGSHGYGAVKRVVLGSVSDYCAHHAHCSVMIVKKPKQ
ncbi:universal stress protein A-like protein [Quillaja saponaria]|uniref:Universal stress protein A-like protein n=1 Tax=Quillaja saponaria TaxID=32244 RepID=A0AAD7LBL7_QUISA|nr:universal stress protein A-like protein [Quillaja saponaria]